MRYLLAVNAAGSSTGRLKIETHVLSVEASEQIQHLRSTEKLVTTCSSRRRLINASK